MPPPLRPRPPPFRNVLLALPALTFHRDALQSFWPCPKFWKQFISEFFFEILESRDRDNLFHSFLKIKYNPGIGAARQRSQRGRSDAEMAQPTAGDPESCHGARGDSVQEGSQGPTRKEQRKALRNRRRACEESERSPWLLGSNLAAVKAQPLKMSPGQIRC